MRRKIDKSILEEGGEKDRGGEKIEDGGRETMGIQQSQLLEKGSTVSSALVIPLSSSQHVAKD